MSLLLGAFLVPLTAVAAVLIVEGSEAPLVAAQPEKPAVGAPTRQQDLTAACSSSGLRLVEAESAKTATPLQQAALDALRPICETVGMPLPGAAATPDVTPTSAPPAPQVVVVEAPRVADDDGEFEYEYDDGEWEIED